MRQSVGLAAWRSQDTAVFNRSSPHGGLFASARAVGHHVVDASFSANAFDWIDESK
jgi:hypothetical protein